MCLFAATTQDPDSAQGFLFSADPRNSNALLMDNATLGNKQGIGILNGAFDPAYADFGYYTTTNSAPGAVSATILPAPDFSAIRMAGGIADGDFIYADCSGQDLSGLSLTGARFDYADLSGASLEGSDLTGATFRHTTLNGTKFGRAVVDRIKFLECDLTDLVLSGLNFETADFSGSVLLRTHLTGSTLRDATFRDTGAAQIDLTDADFSEATISSAWFSNPRRTSFAGTNFGGATLAGVEFSNCDLSGARVAPPPMLTSTSAAPSLFVGATVPFDLITRSWQWSDLRRATILNLPHELSTSVLPLQAAGVRLAGCNQNDFAGLVIQHAVFDEAVLDEVNFHLSDLSGSSFSQASMHGTVLTSSVLTGATLVGAQLGTQNLLFSLAKTDPAYTTLSQALEQGHAATVAAVFGSNGVDVANVTITVPPAQRGTCWVVTDQSGTSYTARLMSQAGQDLLNVFGNAADHADLGDAYLPGADLRWANLYGAFASGVHLYGAGSKLDGAILDAADFSRSNLGTASFVQASLYDAIFDDAILTSAVFQGARLEAGQAGRGVSLQRANLQGADFSGATLHGASLQDAAVCMPDSAAPQGTWGVWLGEVAARDPAIPELAQAARLFGMDPGLETSLTPGPPDDALKAALAKAGGVTLEDGAEVSVTRDRTTWRVVDDDTTYTLLEGYDQNYTAAFVVVTTAVTAPVHYLPLSCRPYLRTGTVTQELRQAFLDNCQIDLSGSASVSAFQRPVDWQIDKTQPSYSLWEGYDESANRMVFVRPAIPSLTDRFQRLGITLLHATVTEDAGAWVLDNDSRNAYDTTLGYIVFNLLTDPAAGTLEIYGCTMRIERLTGADELEYHDIVANPTIVSADNFDSTTIYPNGNTATIVDGVLEEAWMRAPLPPEPPTCVPNDSYYCASAARRLRLG